MGSRMSILCLLLLFAALLGRPAIAAPGEMRAVISLSRQSLTVYEDGTPVYDWPVSTARRGYHTPIGVFHPIRLERTWYSLKYDLAPMPYSVFFHGGYAIHGTTEIRRLGKPVSHGCVRLHPANARILFDLVRQYGWSDTTIVVQR